MRRRASSEYEVIAPTCDSAWGHRDGRRTPGRLSASVGGRLATAYETVAWLIDWGALTHPGPGVLYSHRSAHHLLLAVYAGSRPAHLPRLRLRSPGHRLMPKATRVGRESALRCDARPGCTTSRRPVAARLVAHRWLTTLVKSWSSRAFMRCSARRAV